MTRIWPGLVLAPLFALASIAVGYALVPPACSREAGWLVHASSAVFLALTLAVTAMSWAALRIARREFLPLISFWSGAFFALVIVAQWSAQFFLSPCWH
jgi:hypothetical protein